MAAQTLSVRLQRSDSSTPWGFRLQGGLDFSTPLSIQRITPGSLSDQTGLQAGDAILRIGNENAAEVKHKDAQDMIVRCGNYLELTVQRGAVKIWKPSVTPVNELRGGPVQNIDYGSQDPHLFKTSLAADKQDFQPIGSSHNVKPKPFVTGGSPVAGPPPGTVKAVVHAQYNSPVGLYSSSNIADTLATQTQGLIQGIQSLNVSGGDNQTPVQSAVLQAVQQEDYSGDNLPSGMRKVAAPVTQPGGPSPATGGQPLCGGCGRLIIGVFVRVNNKPLHAECFTCATCGTSLKNTGYFTINEKLYCETHARQLTKPPGPNYEPVNLYSKPQQQQQQQQQPWKQPTPPAPAPAPPAPSAGPARQPGSAKFQWPPPKPYPDSDNENDEADEIAEGQTVILTEQNVPKATIPSMPVPAKPPTPIPSQTAPKFPTPISSQTAPNFPTPIPSQNSPKFPTPISSQAAPKCPTPTFLQTAAQNPTTPVTPGTKLGPKPFVATQPPYEPTLPTSKPTIPTGPKPFILPYQSTQPSVVPKPGPPLPYKPSTLGSCTSPISPPLAPKPPTPETEIIPTPVTEPIQPEEEQSSIVEENLVTPSKAVWPPPKSGAQTTTSQGPISKSVVQWPPPKPQDNSIEPEYQNTLPSHASPPTPQIQSNTPIYNPQSSIPQSIPNTFQKQAGSPVPPLQGSAPPGISSVSSAFRPVAPSTNLPRCTYPNRPVIPPPPAPSQQSQSPQSSKYPPNTQNLTFTPIPSQPATQQPYPVLATAPISPTMPVKPLVSQSKISFQTSTQNPSLAAPSKLTATPLTASNSPLTAPVPPTNPTQSYKPFGTQYTPPSTKGKGAGAPNWMNQGIPPPPNASNVPWSMSAS